MKALTRRVLGYGLRLAGKKRVERAIEISARLAGCDLLLLAHQSVGILKYQTGEESGEQHVIDHVLPHVFAEKRPVLFDVGANIGSYSVSLHRRFPAALIFAFEPNPLTYRTLDGALTPLRVKCFNVGLGDREGTGKIYTYAQEQASQHASMYREVFTELHREASPVESEFRIVTLDDFCRQEAIERIDFLKIDTEGHELAVLKGASRLLADERVNIIQFEFNEMNVVSRVFLKDFYTLLRGYDFHRLDSNRLIPLRQYTAANEIFQFQNVLATRNSVTARLPPEVMW